MRKINIKIQGEEKPFEFQVCSMQTFATLKNKLYLSHQKIVDLYPYINGKTEITPITTGVYDTLYKNPDFVYLNFRTKNQIASASLDAKSAGLSDQSMKIEYLKNFSSPANEKIKAIQLEDKFKKIELSEPGKISAKSFRITDLQYQQLINLFHILKIENGRYMDEKMQIITSNKQALSYSIKESQFTYIIEDKGVSHFFQNQRITQITKEVYEQGFKDKQLRNKVPYLFAFAYEEEEKYFQIEKNIEKIDYTYVQHCFPRGEVNLLTVQLNPSSELLSYFNSTQITYEKVLEFYRHYGQFLIKKFTVGLKRFCSQKITSQIKAKNLEQEQKLATMAAGRIRQYMLESTNEFGQGTKSGQTNIKSNQQMHYDIKAIGGAIEYCQNVSQWKQSVNSWQLWRIIAVNEIQRIQNLLPIQIQQKIQKVMIDHINQIKEKLSAKKTTSLVLAPKISKMKPKVRIESNFETIHTFKQKIYQILSESQNTLIIIFIDKAIRFNLTKMQQTTRIQFRDPSKCFYEKQPGYITACMHNSEVYIATQYGIVKLNFDKITIKLVVEGNWRESTLLISFKNNLYSNGFRGIYEINTKTGQYSIKIGGDWRFFTGTCIKNNLYLFYWNIYCLDLESMIYSKICGGLWNQFWSDFTYPTNDGLRIWQLHKYRLYCLQESTYYPVQFFKNSVAIEKFSSRTLCYKNGFLYLSNFDHNEHLMKIPL